jgi:hypothetical protein
LSVASDVKVINANQILISHNEMIKTIENIKSNPAICLTVFNKEWRGVRMYGQAKYYVAGKWGNMARKLFATKQLTPKGAIVVTVNLIEEQS